MIAAPLPRLCQHLEMKTRAVLVASALVVATGLTLAACATAGPGLDNGPGATSTPTATATGIETSTPTAAPNLTPAASGHDPEAMKSAQRACEAYWPIVGPSEWPDAKALAAVKHDIDDAAEGDNRWGPMAEDLDFAYRVYKGTASQNEIDDKDKTIGVGSRFELGCEAAFGIRQPDGSPQLKQEMLDFPAITTTPTTMPTDAAGIAELACRAWAGNDLHIAELRTSPDAESPFTFPVAQASAAAALDPIWQPLADAMSKAAQLDTVDGMNALADAAIPTIGETTDAIDDLCRTSFKIDTIH